MRSNRHEDGLNEHDAWLKEHEARMANEDRILDKANEILESLKNTHCEHIGWTRGTHGIAAASYFRFHGKTRQLTVLRLETWISLVRYGDY